MIDSNTGVSLRGAKRRVLGRGSGSASVASKMFSILFTGVFRAAKHDCDLTNSFQLHRYHCIFEEFS